MNLNIPRLLLCLFAPVLSALLPSCQSPQHMRVVPPAIDDVVHVSVSPAGCFKHQNGGRGAVYKIWQTNAPVVPKTSSIAWPTGSLVASLSVWPDGTGQPVAMASPALAPFFRHGQRPEDIVWLPAAGIVRHGHGHASLRLPGLQIFVAKKTEDPYTRNTCNRFRKE